MRAQSVPFAATQQGGVFTRAQALAEGWSRDRVDRRMASGAWTRVCGDGLVAAGTARSARVLAWAARLTWPSAVASHGTAAQLHGFPVPSTAQAHVTLPAPVRRTLPGLVVHRLDLPEADVVCLRREPARTTRRRTALDCLRTFPYADARSLATWLFARDELDRAALADELARAPGRWGNKQLRRLLADTDGDAWSEAERRTHEILRAARITGWEANGKVEVEGRVIAVVDVLFRRQRLAVEIDGFAAHGGREAFVSDRQRQNELVNAGYRVLRFTWDDVRHRPEYVLRKIREALAQSPV